MKEQIERIKKQELNLDKTTEVVQQLEKAVQAWKNQLPQFQELMEYYKSEDWLIDKEASDKGSFDGLKCGVLSQDAVYNIYSDQRELNLKIIRVALDYLEN